MVNTTVGRYTSVEGHKGTYAEQRLTSGQRAVTGIVDQDINASL